jgi:putative endonuclease
MVRNHAGQPFDSGLAMLGRRSWQAIRRVAGIECPEPVEGLSSGNLLIQPRSVRAPLMAGLFPSDLTLGRGILREVECPEPVEGLSFIYLLEAEDGAFYIGQSHNVRERLRKHRLGLGSKHTRDHGGAKLVYVEGPCDLDTAIRREQQLKHWSRTKKEALIQGDLSLLKQLSRSRR